MELTGERPKGWAGYFTETVRERTRSDATDMKTVMEVVFGTMSLDTRNGSRAKADVPMWADRFPYVNGGLFSAQPDVPHFSRMARTYLIRAGELRWTDVNPDIFGSMIQAVADGDERANLGMHYTSVPNILKVLNPLFLDDLNAQLERAGTNKQQLGKLKARLAGIRVFDPACGSGNFLVIAYKRLREIEHRANLAAGWGPMKSVIPTNNFRGIEIKSFAAEVARLALIIAEYQCDAIYLDQTQADALFLPLDAENWIVCGNALRMDWLGVCPPPGEREVTVTDGLLDLRGGEGRQKEIDFANDGGEVFICGNPPYKGRNKKAAQEKEDLKVVFGAVTAKHRTLDYVFGWFGKAADYALEVGNVRAAFVATNSICQGEQVPVGWPIVFSSGLRIAFAHLSFKWSNLAANDAGVTVVVVGLDAGDGPCKLFIEDSEQIVSCIGPYLVPGTEAIVGKASNPLFDTSTMYLGNIPKCGGNLIFSKSVAEQIEAELPTDTDVIRKFYGSRELIHGVPRYALWLDKASATKLANIPSVAAKLSEVKAFRKNSKAASTRALMNEPYRFHQMSAGSGNVATIVPRVSSENRPYLPVDHMESGPVVGDKCYALYDAPLWNLALIASRLHWVWIGTVCVRLEMRFSYSNTLGWNTFPVPTLTDADKAELTRAAENILLARESYFPATIADMYDPKRMDTHFPAVRAAHNRNDRILEQIYIGRPFRNDTERLEKLFEMYVAMTGKAG